MRRIIDIIRSQREELLRLQSIDMMPRAAMERIDVSSHLAQVVLGMRRAGKSVICRCALQNAGIPFGYVNFDDEALSKLTTDNLEDVLQAVYEVYGKVEHFLFDEIQNIDGWHLFVNRLLRQGKHIVITGSNAKLLTSELATHLTGRYIPIEVYPFSFDEYIQWKGLEKPEAWKRYFLGGGLPETFEMADPRGYVSALYTAILSKDILGRHQVRNSQRFQDAAYVIMQQYAREISYENLARAAGISSSHTMQTYLGYLAESYLLSLVRHFSPKPAERIRNVKAYVNDPALISYFTGVLGSEEELGWRLENIVYLELMRRRQEEDLEIWYYKDQSYDVDFCETRHGKVVRLIQVSYEISGEKTRKRELSSLLGAARKLNCNDLWLITDHATETLQEGDFIVNIISAPKWLCTGNMLLEQGAFNE